MTYEDSYEREEKDLNLHIAKMIEHMEFENELPHAEKHKRRLIRMIQSLPSSAKVAAEHNMPWIMFGCIERIVHHAEQCLGKDWAEQARRERSEWFGSDEDTQADEDFLYDEDQP